MVSTNQSSHRLKNYKIRNCCKNRIVNKTSIGFPPLNVLRGVCHTTLNANARYAKLFDFGSFFKRDTSYNYEVEDFIT